MNLIKLSSSLSSGSNPYYCIQLPHLFQFFIESYLSRLMYFQVIFYLFDCYRVFGDFYLCSKESIVSYKNQFMLCYEYFGVFWTAIRGKKVFFIFLNELLPYFSSSQATYAREFFLEPFSYIILDTSNILSLLFGNNVFMLLSPLSQPYIFNFFLFRTLYLILSLIVYLALRQNSASGDLNFTDLFSYFDQINFKFTFLKLLSGLSGYPSGYSFSRDLIKTLFFIDCLKSSLADGELLPHRYWQYLCLLMLFFTVFTGVSFYKLVFKSSRFCQRKLLIQQQILFSCCFQPVEMGIIDELSLRLLSFNKFDLFAFNDTCQSASVLHLANLDSSLNDLCSSYFLFPTLFKTLSLNNFMD